MNFDWEIRVREQSRSRQGGSGAATFASWHTMYKLASRVDSYSKMKVERLQAASNRQLANHSCRVIWWRTNAGRLGYLISDADIRFWPEGDLQTLTSRKSG